MEPNKFTAKVVNATITAAKTVAPSTPTLDSRECLAARIAQFMKFCLVGGSGTLVDMTVLYVLTDPKSLALNLSRSKLCAAMTALVNNFVWNELWTFKGCIEGQGRARHSVRAGADWEKTGAQKTDAPYLGSPSLRRFLFFIAICGTGIAFAIGLLHLFHTWLGWNLYLSNLLTIGLVPLWNFGINARFNWRRTDSTRNIEATVTTAGADQ